MNTQIADIGNEEWYQGVFKCKSCETEFMVCGGKAHYCPNCGRKVTEILDEDITAERFTALTDY